jgi:HK97 family phage portal protein
MNLRDMLPFGWGKPSAEANRVRASTILQGDGVSFGSLDDPNLGEFIRDGAPTASGAFVSTRTALFNTAVFRAIDLICSSMGMLPLHMLNRADNTKADEHPLADVLQYVPNDYQSAYDLRSQLQFQALTNEKGGFAQIIWSRGQVYQMVPLDPDRMRVVKNANRTVSYYYRRPDGSEQLMGEREVFHLRGLSADGVNGLSRVRYAREAIGLARQAETAAAKLFSDGVMASGALQTDNSLSDEAYDRLKGDMAAHYTGADNAGKWMILEEGLKATAIASTPKDSQLLEARQHQVEEVARAFGVPRPLLMMDDTSWGTGIEQLGIGFVRYGLQPWCTAWEQTIARVMLTKPERRLYTAKFNTGALTRGSLKDQGEFFSRAMGAGGSQPFGRVNDIRRLLDWEIVPGGDVIPERATATAPAKEKTDEPASTPAD